MSLSPPQRRPSSLSGEAEEQEGDNLVRQASDEHTERKEGSPEALTASSDGQRSSHKWQRHVLSLTPLALPGNSNGNNKDTTATMDVASSSMAVGATRSNANTVQGEQRREGDADIDEEAKEEQVVKALFDAPARAISCDTVLFVDESDSLTPPPAPSSQFLSIPDAGGGGGETQLTQQQQQQKPARQGTAAPLSATTPERKTNARGGDRERSDDSPPPLLQRSIGKEAGRADHRAPPPPAAGKVFPFAGSSHHTPLPPPPRPSPPPSQRPSGIATPTHSLPQATHLRMSTPSRPCTPESQHQKVNSAGSWHISPSTNHTAGARPTFPSAPPQQPQQQVAPQPWRATSPALVNPHSMDSAGSTQGSRNSSVHTTQQLPAHGPHALPHVSPSATATAAAAIGRNSPASGRLSTQMITRAAAARPLASPGTLWICLDDDDDGDVEEPTSPSSPTLNNIRIEAAAMEQPWLERMLVKVEAPGVEDEGKRDDDCDEDGDAYGNSTTATQRLFDNIADFEARSKKIFRLSVGGGEPFLAAHSRNNLAGGYGGGREDGEQQAMSSRTRPPAAATVAPGKGTTISETLSPTFRHRRGNFIRLDDTDDDDEGEEEDDDEDGDGNADVVVDEARAPLSQEKWRATQEEKSESEGSRRPPLTVIGDDDDDTSSSEGVADGLLPDDENASHTGGPAQRGTVQNMSFASAATMPYIDHDDDDSEPGQASHSSSSEDVKLAELSPPQSPTIPGRGQQQQQQQQRTLPTPQSASSPHPYVRDDDDDDEEDVRRRTEATKEVAKTAKARERKVATTAQQRKQMQRHTGEAEEQEQEEEDEHSPTRSVKDFIFPDRNGHGSPLFPFHNEDNLHDIVPGHSGKGNNSSSRPSDKGRAPANRGGEGRKGRGSGGGTSTRRSGSGGEAALYERPVDQLQQFFPTRFTKKSFAEAAKRIMPSEHFLQKGEFWSAFSSAEFVGEGSFGLVWKSTTVDGDLVAVKTCPVSLCAKPNIEDAFSALREVAVMRFLNEMQVPYVLPLHSAFLVKEREALPPLAAEALAWRREQRRRAEATVLERRVRMLSARGHVAHKHNPDKKGKGTESEESLLEQEIQAELVNMAKNESAKAKATRARLSAVRLPRFLSISEDDILQCDATVILVFELCDGDVESIPRADGVAKGVAYCVSSALAAMHELGLLHLDLKPSNILFAYEHGPSQQTPRASALLAKGADSNNSANSDSNKLAVVEGKSSMAAVKFYLSDYGNCRIVGPKEDDRVEDAFGTFEYMDLQALRDAVCCRATDNFSLGSSLYEMLFGKRVYPKCTNPKCHSEEDHTRECFVEAASKPIVLPLPAAAAAAAAAAVDEARQSRHKDKDNGDGADPHGPQRGRGRLRGRREGVENASSRNEGARGAQPQQPPPQQQPKIPLTTLQRLVVALLNPDPAKRMTAAQCRDHLIRTYNITQTDKEGFENSTSQQQQPQVPENSTSVAGGEQDHHHHHNVQYAGVGRRTYAEHNEVPPSLLTAHTQTDQ